MNSRRTRWNLQLLVQIEEEKRLNAELQDLLDKTQLKLKQYKRQIDEAVRASRSRASQGDCIEIAACIERVLCAQVEVASITLNKYRRAQAEAEEAQTRAGTNTRSRILEFIFICRLRNFKFVILVTRNLVRVFTIH